MFGNLMCVFITSTSKFPFTSRVISEFSFPLDRKGFLIFTIVTTRQVIVYIGDRCTLVNLIDFNLF